jgi:hypothetical protein
MSGDAARKVRALHVWREHFPETTAQVVESKETAEPRFLALETFPPGIDSRSCLPRSHLCERTGPPAVHLGSDRRLNGERQAMGRVVGQC